jgi:hypothetical protein
VVDSEPGQESRVRVLVSNPAAVHVEAAGTDYLVAGIRPDAVTAAIDDITSFDDVVARARSLPGEFSVVAVDGESVRAFRSITSSYDVFFARRPDGTHVVGDHFRDVLAELPVSARTVPDSVAVDHLLLGCRPNGTYVREVDRLGHGEVLTWARDGQPELELVDTLSVHERLSPTAAADRLDQYLDTVCGGLGGDSVATMLSGGVDSALLHTYLDTDQTVNGTVDSPEFEVEDSYARGASALLGSDHLGLSLSESDYLGHLEATIDATGQPLMFPQGALMHHVFRDAPHDTYVNGALADGVFGTGITALAYLAAHLGPITGHLPSVSWEVDRMKETAAALRRPATDIDGCAMGFRIHADESEVASYVGRDAVEDAKRRRLLYTARRCSIPGPPGYAAHMHLGHCIEYFHDVILPNWRHAAHAQGVSLVAPFAGRTPLELALAVPATRRYARFARPTRTHPTRVVSYKYLLKDLLADRLPEYDTAKPKGHSLLPFQRYLDDGPLADVFERYSVPEFVPLATRDRVRDGTGEVAWYAANYAVWRDRILENDDLGRLERTSVIDR